MFTDFEIARIVSLPYFRARVGNDERGASMVEYALVLALIAVVGVVGLTFLGNTTSDKLKCTGGGIAGAPLNDATAGDYYDVDGDKAYNEDVDKLVADCT